MESSVKGRGALERKKKFKRGRREEQVIDDCRPRGDPQFEIRLETKTALPLQRVRVRPVSTSWILFSLDPALIFENESNTSEKMHASR